MLILNVNHLLRSSYERLPAFGQTVGLNLYGLRNRSRLRRWTQVLSTLAATETWTPLQQELHTETRLARILQHAIQHVPRYQGFRSRLKDLVPGGGTVFGVLAGFPEVTKEEILREPTAFRSLAFAGKRLVKTFTSGTTGTPFTTWLEPEALVTSDALWWRRTVWAGYERGDWIARLVGDPVVPLHHRNPRSPWRISRTDRRIYLSTFHLNHDTATRIAGFLARRKPAFLMGYPSALDALARLCDTPPGWSSWKPKAILYSSEPLHAHQRQSVEQIFSAQIRGLYGCAERILSAAECDHGCLHLGLVDGYLEGQFGRLRATQPARITGLLNRAMPMIRYRLGDALTARPGQSCPCRRTLPIVDSVVTKQEDEIVTPTGRRISPSLLTFAFKEAPGLEKSQVIQRETDVVEVLVQVSEADYASVRQRLEIRLQEILFGEMRLQITKVDEVGVSKAGKTRFVINEAARDR